jgi:L-threonylcarbamoyladenylate synthase
MADTIPDLAAIQAAARMLEEGALVAFPTETVYGLGADAENPVAIAKIYTAKGRPSNHPIIVHVAPDTDIGYWADAIPAEARTLINGFWPGPLTLILKRATHIPDAVSGGQDSIGLRCPSHPVARALLQAFKGGKGGIAAPSANRFGHVSPTTAQHVREEFGAGPDNPVACILNGGQSDVGIESTILDLSRMATHGPVLLRPGRISAAEIMRVTGIQPNTPDASAPRASGTLDAHYAPGTPVALVAPEQMHQMAARLISAGRRVALIRRTAAPIPAAAAQLGLPAMPDGYAHDLYAALREMDGAGANIIIVESLPQEEQWQGINDRLRRAAHDSLGVMSRLLDNGKTP